MKILVTGTAGFIGMHLTKKLLEDKNNEIVALDNINDYYETSLKYDRLTELGVAQESIKENELVQSNKFPNLSFIKTDLENKEVLFNLFEKHKFDYVINLAAQAGVRYSIEDPESYISRNIVGFFNILEACRKFPVKHLVYASSSSVYGANAKIPFSEDDKVDAPVSLYAASKKSNELMAHVYSNLFKIPTTGLRFFTVYGPWGRPDMALMLFANSIVKGEEIKVFNHGKMERDFTYVDDIVNGIIKLIIKPSKQEIPYNIFNIGGGKPVKLLRFIEVIEQELGIKAKMKFMDIQPGDVPKTYADTTLLEKEIGYKPEISIEDGVRHFVDWYKKYYGI